VDNFSRCGIVDYSSFSSSVIGARAGDVWSILAVVMAAA
jgi:hypothetical protein